jgi:hypothetical protein
MGHRDHAKRLATGFAKDRPTVSISIQDATKVREDHRHNNILENPLLQ